MKALIIEDEVMAQKSLIRLLTNNFPEMEIVGKLSSVKDSVMWLDNPSNHTDIIFMDVELADGCCFEIFRKTTVNAKVIMTTAYDSYALKAFEAGSVDYLLKPVELADLKRAVARCKMSGGGIDVQALLSSLTAPQPARKEYKERYLVRFNDRIIPISTSEIAYVYSEEKSNYLVTFDSHKYIIDSSLDVIIEELDPAVFFRISRGCIIAINAISSIIKQMGGRLKIISKPESSFEMMVSRSRVDDFLEWMEK
ncbi:MAG: LytTR family DNA-binding domain-containing protein [Bacteroidales bacterium]|nr:LytTR family DNA-binding domain-containing protein [Bacteroidales bacterium]